MSQPRNTPTEQLSMPSTDRPLQHESTELDSHTQRSDSGSYRRLVDSSGQGRRSGELEGSTLGSSSREGARRTLNKRRVQSSSGFLLDALPRSESLRLASLPAHSESEKTTRFGPHSENGRAKKRSRFPWSRHRDSSSENLDKSSQSDPLMGDQAVSSNSGQVGGRTSFHADSGVDNDHRVSPPAMDRDALQIVNLALNLNESRKRTTLGQTPGLNGRAPLSVSQPASAPIGRIAGALNGRLTRLEPYQAYGGGTVKESLPVRSPVVHLLPSSVANDEQSFDFSERTLARADRARRHFELFHEYMRLLPLLAPLPAPKGSDSVDVPSTRPVRASEHRTYNPLQTIRNRKIRYREKSSIDAEADGWLDVENVHGWIDSIHSQYGNVEHDEMQIMKLPPFRQGQHAGSQGDAQEYDTAISPPSSLRRVSRTNSVKTNRPRLDWTTSPAELLADALWLEDISHRAKVVDKDGNKLYSDPSHLFVTQSKVEHTRSKSVLSVDMVRPEQDRPESRNESSSNLRPALETEFKSVGRGRHKHRFHGHSHFSRSHSSSTSPKRSRWDKVRMRAESTASESSPDRRKSSEKSHRMWGHSRKKSEAAMRKDTFDQAEVRQSRSKSRDGLYNRRTRKAQTIDTPSLDSEAIQVGRQASVSSTGSLGNRNLARMSFEEMDSTAPNSPAHASYFPSIAVKLSPPSSRSPSPAKKRLRHKIVSRHERTKSKHEYQERHEDEDLGTAVSQQSCVQSEDHAEKASKLEPSPLPDMDTAADIDTQTAMEGRGEDFRDRKGQQSPESKLRGIFKGPGRIAEIVGNEVSKVGDFILKKDTAYDTRKPSFAASDDSNSELDESRHEKRYGSKALLRRQPNSTDDPGRLPRRETDKAISKSPLPTFTSSSRQVQRHEEASDVADRETALERKHTKGRSDDLDEPRRLASSRSKTFDFGQALQASRGRTKHANPIKDPSNPFSLTTPPVTGLTRARASPVPASQGDVAKAGAGRAWSISDRSIRTSTDSGLPGKAEIERTLALLLSSGITAREINRRLTSSRDPPRWLLKSAPTNTPVPRVTRLGEFDTAAQNYLRRFEMTQYSFQNSMHQFSTATSNPLRSQLKELENLINEKLTPQVRATADTAEDLCVQLNTTSTLAVKSLSDALDKGIRKRRRRLRWARRAAFSILEWMLVGMLWWVWLIVMAFKFLRGVCRGAITGVRWVLWI